MKTEGKSDTYQGLLGLDRLSTRVKSIVWFLCLCFAIGAFFTLYDFSRAVAEAPIGKYLIWLCILCPTCAAVAVARLAGIRWRYALSLFVFVSIIALVVLFLLLWVNLFFGAAA